MESEESVRIDAMKEALRNVFETLITDDSDPDFWKLRASEVIEELETEGIFIE